MNLVDRYCDTIQQRMLKYKLIALDKATMPKPNIDDLIWRIPTDNFRYNPPYIERERIVTDPRINRRNTVYTNTTSERAQTTIRF